MMLDAGRAMDRLLAAYGDGLIDRETFLRRGIRLGYSTMVLLMLLRIGEPAVHPNTGGEQRHGEEAPERETR